MISLGIFADSFGSESPKVKIPDKSWIDFIREKKIYSVNNYSKGGTSLYYSYELFMQNHHKHEKNIFLVTNPHRITLPEDSPLSMGRHQSYHRAIQHHDLATGSEKREWKLLIDYYENIHNYEQEERMHELMVQEIKRTRPDTIMYPSLSLDESVFSLFHIVLFENEKLGIDIAQTGKTTFFSKWLSNCFKQGIGDRRKCHMTEENNLVVANMFLSKLNGIDCEITINDLVEPTHPIEYYFRKD